MKFYLAALQFLPVNSNSILQCYSFNHTMADNSADVNLIMNLFKKAADDYSTKNKTRNTSQLNNNEVSPAIRGPID